jgi:hypothetical protein
VCVALRPVRVCPPKWEQQDSNLPCTDLQSALAPCLFYSRAARGDFRRRAVWLLTGHDSGLLSPLLAVASGVGRCVALVLVQEREECFGAADDLFVLLVAAVGQ